MPPSVTRVQVALSAANLPEATWQDSTGDVAPCSKVTAHCGFCEMPESLAADF